MKNLLSHLTFPFVYLDSSFLHRTNNIAVQRLTRKLLLNDPKRFKVLLDELVVASMADHSYYEKIIHLQQQNIISTLVTFEALNPELEKHSPNLVPLFGNVSIIPPGNDAYATFAENLVLWGENVKVKKYIAAAMAILNSPCIVAEDTFLSVSVGKSLTQYIKSDSMFYVLGSNNKKKMIGDNYMMHELSPKKFIQILHSQL